MFIFININSYINWIDILKMVEGYFKYKIYIQSILFYYWKCVGRKDGGKYDYYDRVKEFVLNFK